MDAPLIGTLFKHPDVEGIDPLLSEGRYLTKSGSTVIPHSYEPAKSAAGEEERKKREAEEARKRAQAEEAARRNKLLLEEKKREEDAARRRREEQVRADKLREAFEKQKEEERRRKQAEDRARREEERLRRIQEKERLEKAARGALSAKWRPTKGQLEIALKIVGKLLKPRPHDYAPRGYSGKLDALWKSLDKIEEQAIAEEKAIRALISRRKHTDADESLRPALWRGFLWRMKKHGEFDPVVKDYYSNVVAQIWPDHAPFLHGLASQIVAWLTDHDLLGSLVKLLEFRVPDVFERGNMLDRSEPLTQDELDRLAIGVAAMKQRGIDVHFGDHLLDAMVVVVTRYDEAYRPPGGTRFEYIPLHFQLATIFDRDPVTDDTGRVVF